MTDRKQHDHILWQNYHSLVNSLKISAKEKESLFYWEDEYRSLSTRHSSAPAPEPAPGIDASEELHKIHIGIHCPSCDWKQIVPLDDWIFQSKYGHGYTCGSGKCPSHTHLIRNEPDDDLDDIREQAKREERERIAKQIEHNASNRKYHSYTTSMQIVEYLRGEQP